MLKVSELLKYKQYKISVYQVVNHIKFSPYLIIMLSAPSGVTKIAGAKAYAAKLAISPTTTGNCTSLVPPHTVMEAKDYVGTKRLSTVSKEIPTCYQSYPPQWLKQVRVATNTCSNQQSKHKHWKRLKCSWNDRSNIFSTTFARYTTDETRKI